MPEPNRADRAAQAARWRIIGRLLPRRVRERVFEPAFTDLLYRRLTDDHGGPFGLYVLGTVLGCLPLALRQQLVMDGRLTRTGRVLATAMLIVVTAVVVLRRFAGELYGN